MTTVAFRLGKVHALGDVVVLDVNTYDVLFGLSALVALRANLDFERRSIILRNTGGKPYAVPMRLTLRTTINAVPRVSPMMAGTLHMISWDESADGKASANEADNSDEDDPEISKLARQPFFNTSAIYAAAEFRFTEEATTRVLAEISAFRRLSPPGISHTAAVVVFTGDITAIPSANHSDIYRTLRAWARECAAIERGDVGRVVGGLCRARFLPIGDRVPLVRSGPVRTRTGAPRRQRGASDHPGLENSGARRPAGDCVQKVEEGNLTFITDELLVFLTQLVDDLPLDILSHSDKQPGTYVLSRTLEPHLVWSTCTEIDEDNRFYPSQALYLEIDVIDLTFWDPIASQNTTEDEEIGGADEEEEEEEPSREERDDPDYIPESEAGIANESSQPREKNEEEKKVEPDGEEEEGNEQAESEYEGLEAVVRDAARERAQEQRKRKCQETADGKRATTNVSPVDPSIGDPWRDSEPLEEEDDGTATEGSRSRRRRRSESPAPSGSPSRSSIRLHQDLGVRASSPVVLSPTR
ncbi:hypothetical protein CBR_g50718 [Chara braunii]|uniref:Uncharacterized protein n=1 Tax=Chara braunii TaxID=69332 RepID=A0A388K5R7_CHABU|nr:hypothetical protein CBR_g50718 [Chara braunii]|eukprot:GBG65356.1 hypothetical protein CBR_g50718 [Chara braunii]